MRIHLFGQSFLLFFLVTSFGFTQEINVFTVADFDLKGKVKTCAVSTDYGSEEYEFDQNGRLTKLVTRYSGADYEVAHYKFIKGHLSDKRQESYRNGEIDRSTSIAHLYEIDSVSNLKITEKVVNYDKKLLEVYEYQYDSLNRLSKIVNENEKGTDITLIDYQIDPTGSIITYDRNGVPIKTVFTSSPKDKDGVTVIEKFTTTFLEGQRSSATAEITDPLGNVLEIIAMAYMPATSNFKALKTQVFTYDAEKVLSKISISSVGGTENKFINFKFDLEGNWVKEIIEPENAYKTRRISYYK